MSNGHRVDRLGWADGFVFDAFGLRVGLRVHDATDLPAAQRVIAELDWPVLEEPTADVIFSLRMGKPGSRRGVKNYHLLYAGGGQIQRTLETTQAWNFFTETLHHYVTTSSQKYVFLAGSMAVYQGRGILLPGFNGGADHILEALQALGATAFSQRFIIVCDDGAVAAYPKPSMDKLPVAIIAFTERREKVNVVRARVLTTGEASLQLFPHVINTRANPQKALSALAKLGAGATSVYCRHACEKKAVQALLRKL